MLSEANEFLQDFKLKYNKDVIISMLKELRNLRVLVIGDTIIDQYCYCSSTGKSPKDNVMVARYLSEETFAGGVLATVNHIAGFCDDVHLVTCLGTGDNYERFIRSHLKKNIKVKFFYREDAPTVVKRRFVEPNSLIKMFGISFLEDYPLPNPREVCDYLRPIIKDYGLVVVADFGHGFIGKGVIRELKSSKFLAVNTQTNTDNMGFNLITRYYSADYICLDEPETRLACQDKFSKLENLILALGCDLRCDKIAVTHGQYDTMVYSGGTFYKIPIFSREVRDTIGAGDAFFSITSLCVKAGFPIDLVGFIGNAVGALKVRIVCNRSSVEPEALFKFIRELLK